MAQTLAPAVRAAFPTTPAARAADEGVRAAALDLLQLQGDYRPNLTLRGVAGGEYYDEAGEVDDPETRFAREIALGAEVTLFDGFARANRVYRNSARLDGAIFRLLDASETLALSAVQAYVDVARHLQLQRVSDQNVARHVEIKRQIDDLVAGGRQPASAAFEVDERLLAARLARLDVRNALANARARYVAVIDAEAGASLVVPGLTDLPASRDQLVARAVGASFRIRLADTVIRERLYEREVVEGAWQPRVTLRGGARYGVDRFGNEGEESDVFVGIGLEWELYSGGRKARTGAVAARARQAEAERQEAVREVQEFATRAWNSYETGVERVVLLELRRRASESVVAQYREEFRAGTRTLLDVLDAERTLFNVRFEEASARAALDFSAYRLLAAQSRLADHFGVSASDMAFDPTFESRARATAQPTSVFRTEIQALE
ncbi:MAG: TolC family protein [Pseudomonadota bacterium]